MEMESTGLEVIVVVAIVILVVIARLAGKDNPTW